MTSALARVDALRAAIEAASTVEELRELRAKAKAVEEYLRSRGEPLSADARRVAAMLLVIARRIGEMLAFVTPGYKEETQIPKGISRKQSSRWQQLAAVPEDVFEQYIATAQQPTLNGALKYARHAEGASAPVETATCTGEDLEALVQRETKFRTVYADPPWAYGNQGSENSTDLHYSTMKVEAIAALPVEKLVEDVAQLHLWTTNGFLREAFDIIDAWGFTYKSVLVWVKPQMGMGNYWRVSHEFLLLATRGGASFPDDQRAHMSWISAPRMNHSSKPYVFRQMVESVGQAPRLELFGRNAATGWVVWGNEVERGLFEQDVEEYGGEST